MEEEEVMFVQCSRHATVIVTKRNQQTDNQSQRKRLRQSKQSIIAKNGIVNNGSNDK